MFICPENVEIPPHPTRATVSADATRLAETEKLRKDIETPLEGG